MIIKLLYLISLSKFGILIEENPLSIMILILHAKELQYKNLIKDPLWKAVGKKRSLIATYRFLVLSIIKAHILIIIEIFLKDILNFQNSFKLLEDIKDKLAIEAVFEEIRIMLIYNLENMKLESQRLHTENLHTKQIPRVQVQMEILVSR